MTVRCCVCHKVREQGQWKDRPEERSDAVSHTYCPHCLGQSLEQMKTEGETLAGFLRVTA